MLNYYQEIMNQICSSHKLYKGNYSYIYVVSFSTVLSPNTCPCLDKLRIRKQFLFGKTFVLFIFYVTKNARQQLSQLFNTKVSCPM